MKKAEEDSLWVKTAQKSPHRHTKLPSEELSKQEPIRRRQKGRNTKETKITKMDIKDNNKVEEKEEYFSASSSN